MNPPPWCSLDRLCAVIWWYRSCKIPAEKSRPTWNCCQGEEVLFSSTMADCQIPPHHESASCYCNTSAMLIMAISKVWFIINYNDISDWCHFSDVPISQGNGAKSLRHGGIRYLNMSLLQIYYGVHQWKKLENWLIFGEVMGKSLVSCFLTHSVYK